MAMIIAVLVLVSLGLVGLAGMEAHRAHLWQDSLATLGLGEPVPEARAQVACDAMPGGRRSSSYHQCTAILLPAGGETPLAQWQFRAAWGLFEAPADLGRGVRRLAWSNDGYGMVTTWSGLADRAWDVFIGPLLMIGFCLIPLFVVRWLRRSQEKIAEAAAAGQVIEVDLLRRIREVSKNGVVSWIWETAYDDPATGKRRRFNYRYADGVFPLTLDWPSSRGLALMGPKRPIALLTERLWPLELDPTDYTRIVTAAAVDRENDHARRRVPPEQFRDWTKEAPSFATQLEKAVALGEQGDGDACYTVGWLIFHGEGVAKDSAVAAQWFERGALAGDPRAQHNLAYLLHRGEGVAKNDGLALFWSQVAASRYATIEDAQSALGLRAGAGVGVAPRDIDHLILAARDWQPGTPAPAFRG